MMSQKCPTADANGEQPGCGDAEAKQEQKHLLEVVLSFKDYINDLNLEVSRRKRNMSSISGLIPDNEAHFEQLQRCISGNYRFLMEMVRCSKFILTGSDDAILEIKGETDLATEARNLSKVRSTLHQCAREWSTEGSQERRKSFQPLLEYLKKYCPAEDGHKRVLVPGSGLGRLPAEIVALGYSCQGNEVSYQMLLMTEFILNELLSSEANSQRIIHPWIHDTSNVMSSADMTREVRIPDRSASEILASINPKFRGKAEMSMCAGEFVEVYSKQRAEWDAIITCFFIDTAPEVAEYIEVIHGALKPGGVWINGGPLLWHWQNNGPKSAFCKSGDSRYDVSQELTYEQLKAVILGFGFRICEEQFQEVTYTTNIKSMSKTLYTIVQFAAIKL